MRAKLMSSIGSEGGSGKLKTTMIAASDFRRGGVAAGANFENL